MELLLLLAKGYDPDEHANTRSAPKGTMSIVNVHHTLELIFLPYTREGVRALTKAIDTYDEAHSEDQAIQTEFRHSAHTADSQDERDMLQAAIVMCDGTQCEDKGGRIAPFTIAYRCYYFQHYCLASWEQRHREGDRLIQTLLAPYTRPGKVVKAALLDFVTSKAPRIKAVRHRGKRAASFDRVP